MRGNNAALQPYLLPIYVKTCSRRWALVASTEEWDLRHAASEPCTAVNSCQSRPYFPLFLN